MYLNDFLQALLEEHAQQRTLHVTSHDPVRVTLEDPIKDFEWPVFYDTIDQSIPGTLDGRVRCLTSNAHYKPHWDSPGRTHATFGKGCLGAYIRPLRVLRWAKRSEPWCKLFSDSRYLRQVIDPDLAEGEHEVTLHLAVGSIFKYRHLPTLMYWADKYGYVTLPKFIRERAQYHVDQLMRKLERDRPISYFSVAAKWQVKYLELAGILDEQQVQYHLSLGKE